MCVCEICPSPKSQTTDNSRCRQHELNPRQRVGRQPGIAEEQSDQTELTYRGNARRNTEIARARNMWPENLINYLRWHAPLSPRMEGGGRQIFGLLPLQRGHLDRKIRPRG